MPVTTIRRTLLFILGLVFAAPIDACADGRLPAIIGDNMVMQQGQPVPVWGWDEPGTHVTVRIAGQRHAAMAGQPEGRWRVTLNPLEGGRELEMTVAGTSTARVENILVGELWLASGQSNMEWPLQKTRHGEEAIASADDRALRLFSVERRMATAPKDTLKGRWVVTSPEAVSGFSAVAYHFGRELRNALSRPVGLIHSSWGGTPMESWISRAALQGSWAAAPLFDFWEEKIAAQSRYGARLEQQKKQGGQAEKKGKGTPRRPRPPLPSSRLSHRPSVLYNAMIAPLVPYALRGAIWYQGESNVRRAGQYRQLFPLLIADWREAWGQGSFPFFFVQIAPFDSYPPEVAAELRAAQFATLRTVPNTGMVVTMDIGNPQDIHPRNKTDVGERPARWALARTYGRREVAYSGPLYESMSVEGEAVRLHFAHVDGGLLAQGGALTHFEIAGKDRQFVKAEAEIEEETIVVRSREVKEPVAVRYGWGNAVEPNLFNEAGLPASPFRTDDWPLPTDSARQPRW